MMKLERILELMEKSAKKMNAPVFEFKFKKPFDILVAAVLSTRTKDEITLKAVTRLLSRFKTVDAISNADVKEIANLIYPVGFYREKAKKLKKLAKILKKKYKSKVPRKKASLLKLPGVGEKVANVVLANAFGEDVIAVDTHVHRIANRLGLVNTKSIRETEKVLNKIIPRTLRKRLNKIFVAYGQTICLPKNPKCDICSIKKWCKYYSK